MCFIVSFVVTLNSRIIESTVILENRLDNQNFSIKGLKTAIH